MEALTYRHGGHSRADPGKYKPPGELEAWLAYDPIKVYRATPRATRCRRCRHRRHRRRGRRRGRRGDRGSQERTPARPAAPPSRMCGQTEDTHGDPDLPRRGGARHRAGDGAGRVGRADRRGRRRCRRGLQDHDGAARALRPRARHRHPHLRAGHPRCRDGRRHDRDAADRGDHVLRLLRRLLGPGGQRDGQDSLHDQRPGHHPARRQERQRRQPALRRPALPVDRELGDGRARHQGRRALDSRGRGGPDGRGRPQRRPGPLLRAQGALLVQGRGPRRADRGRARHGEGAPSRARTRRWSPSA